MFPFDDVIMTPVRYLTVSSVRHDIFSSVTGYLCINTLRPRQNGRHFADDIFKCIFLNENVSIAIKIPLKFVPKGPINNIPALVQIMAWRRSCDKPLSEPMMVSLPTHICVTRPQWVLCWHALTRNAIVILGGFCASCIFFNLYGSLSMCTYINQVVKLWYMLCHINLELNLKSSLSSE